MRRPFPGRRPLFLSLETITFVLVHGTGHGGWCWKFVRRILEGQGHCVYTPTLTGCGERSHLLHPDIGLETHIRDIVNVLEWEELEGVVLVGHSYGGCVVSGVADRAKGRLRHLVYLDTVILSDGESLIGSRRQISDAQRDADVERRRSMAPDGKYIVARSGELYGVPPEPAELLEWMNRKADCAPAEELAGAREVRERRRGRRPQDLHPLHRPRNALQRDKGPCDVREGASRMAL